MNQGFQPFSNTKNDRTHTSKGAQAQPTQPHTCCCSTIYIKHRSISNFKIRQKKLPEDGLDRLKHVGVVGIILTK